LNAITSGAGVGWADYDMDGYLDLFVANFDGNNYLFHNQRDGTFLAITAGAIVNEGASESYGTAWGDYNNDGFPDLVVANGFESGKANFLYLNNGNGTFTKITGDPIVSVTGNFSACSWADYDRDGYLDLFVANPGGTSLLFHNNGDGTFSRKNSAVSVISPAFVGSWADYDNDGWPDLFVANGGISDRFPNFLFRNRGNGLFTKVLTPNFAGLTRGSICAAWGDYDNDGFMDVFVGNNGEPNELYHNNGNGTFTRVVTGAIVTDIAESVSAAWGDYDNDGWLDLFVGNRISATAEPAQGFLYHNNGDGTFTKITTGAIAEFTTSAGGAAWGDYDNDGFPDLFVSGLAAVGPAVSGLFHNTGNANHWLKVKCAGIASNRMGIGAKVHVHATIHGTPVWQLREITSGDGYGNGALIANFGLGDATNVDLVRIEWPSGFVQESHNIAPNKALTITEPPLLLAGLAKGVPQFWLKGEAGASYEIQSATTLGGWATFQTVTVTNINGTAQILDPIPPRPQQGFYRAVSR
jgi:hypothetical protein